MRSGAMGDLPAASRRMTASPMSSSGSMSTATGSSSGMKAGSAWAPVMTPGGMLPVTLIAAPAITRPISIDPASPMKMCAGWKLCGRKPMHTPTITASITDGSVA